MTYDDGTRPLRAVRVTQGGRLLGHSVSITRVDTVSTNESVGWDAQARRWIIAYRVPLRSARDRIVVTYVDQSGRVGPSRVISPVQYDGNLRVACESDSDACLVTWGTGQGIRGRMLVSGEATGPILSLSSAPGSADTAWNNAANTFLVMWEDTRAGRPGRGSSRVSVQIVDATGVPMGRPSVVLDSPRVVSLPTLVASQLSTSYLLSWSDRTGVRVRRIDGMGRPVGRDAVVAPGAFLSSDFDAFKPPVSADSRGNWLIGYDSRRRDTVGVVEIASSGRVSLRGRVGRTDRFVLGDRAQNRVWLCSPSRSLQKVGILRSLRIG